MRTQTLASISLAVLSLTACGTDAKKGNNAVEPSADSQAPVAISTERPENVPAGLVTKVPLDANGKEMLDKAETREALSAEIADGAEADSQFSSGAPLKMNDELDESSASQWGRYGSRYGQKYAYWSRPISYGHGGGYGYGGGSYGGGSYGGGYGYNGYSPYLYIGGNSYGYSYRTSYSYNNCNYYSYGFGGNYGGYRGY